MAYESFRPNKCSVPISDFMNFLALLGWPRTKTLRNGFQTGIMGFKQVSFFGNVGTPPPPDMKFTFQKGPLHSCEFLKYQGSLHSKGNCTNFDVDQGCIYEMYTSILIS